MMKILTCKHCGEEWKYYGRGVSPDYCFKDTCQGARREHILQRSLLAKRKYDERKKAGLVPGKYGPSLLEEPTGRLCQKCGKEIMRYKARRSGYEWKENRMFCRECWQIINNQFSLIDSQRVDGDWLYA